MSLAVVDGGTLGTVQTITPEIVNILEVANKILNSQVTEASLPQNTNTKEVLPNEVELNTLLTTIKTASESLRTIVDFSRLINEIGIASEERSSILSQEILPVAIKGIINRLYKQEAAQAGGLARIYADIYEYDLYKAYATKHGDDFKCPEWYQALTDYLEISNRLHNLPQPIDYLEHSAAAKPTEYQRQFGRIEILTNDKKRLEGLGKAGTDEHTGIITQLDTIDQEIRAFLAIHHDVDPKKMPNCCKQINLEVAVQIEVAEKMLQLYNGIGGILKVLIPEKPTDIDSPIVEIPELLKTKKDLGTELKSHQVAPAEIASSALTLSSFSDITNKESVIASLLETYLEIRKSLQIIKGDYKRQYSSDQEYNQVKRSLDQSLQKILPGTNSEVRNLLLALNNYSNDQIRFHQAQLLISAVPDNGGHAQIYVDQPENVQLLEQVVHLAVNGSNKTAEFLRSELKTSSLNSTIAICHKARELSVKKDIDRLAWFFDLEIEKFDKETNFSVTQGTGLLLTLLAVSEDPEIRTALRGRIKKMDEIPSTLDKMFQKINKDGPQGVLIERIRTRLSQRFDDNLSNYWGQEELVAELRTDIEDHLLLLKHTRAYAGIPSKKVFKNGHVFYGDPGSGKSFLALCLANEYGLPYLKISREEMSKAQVAAINSKEASAEDTISKFLSEKAEQALKMQKISGAPAAILMIDEMEAEFLKRNPETSPRAELISTNIMLLVIEKLMAKYPEIIFVAATNHIDLVDRAALRVGRYGIGKYLGRPDQKSIQQIILGNLKELGFKTTIQDLETNSEFEKLVAASDGLMPEPISLAICNKISTYRALALEAGEDLTNSNEIPFDLLISGIELIKRQTNYRFSDSKKGEASLPSTP